MKKYYKIVYGFDDSLNYLPITSDELHKAYVLAMEGGKAIFESGFLQNRDKDILRIIPDWHTERGWNKGHKMQAEDYDDIRHLEEQYKKTLENAKLLAEYIVRENKKELLSVPAPLAFKEAVKLGLSKPVFSKDVKQLADKFKVN